MEILKKRGLSSSEASRVRKQGHEDALNFARSMGLSDDYKNDIKAKKDVIDPSGDAHSVKSGIKKWQIFLYGFNRFDTDLAFKAMNGVGEILKMCLHSFPNSFDDYWINKSKCKDDLKVHMRALCEKLRERYRLKAFIQKSIFNGTEVNYLTIKHNEIYHVFHRDDIVNCLGDNFSVENSKARNFKQFDDQKVIMKHDGKNVAELEMRNDSKVHYREIRFNMLKSRAMNLLLEKITLNKAFNENILVYGNAIKTFGRWKKSS